LKDENGKAASVGEADTLSAGTQTANASSIGNVPAAPPAALPFRFAAGDRLADRYLIIRYVASGGMGDVYEAHDEDLDVRIALKTLRPDRVDPHHLERFRREVALARRVTHPNVCRLHDAGFDVSPRGDVAFLTMELLAGDTLAADLARRGRWSTVEAGPIVDQLIDGLAAAHRSGVVHRDFKSANVLLVPEGSGPPRAVITDFGIARADAAGSGLAETLTHSGAVVGSPAYMAPEQVAGEPVTAASDIYALGVVLYELLTGRLPFVRDTVLATASARLTEPPPRPGQVVADLDPRWDDVVHRCLAREPDDRPSLPEIRAALTGAMPPRRRQVRPRALAIGAGVAAVAVVAAIAIPLARRPAEVPLVEPGPAPVAAPRPATFAVAIVPPLDRSRTPAPWLVPIVRLMLGADVDAQPSAILVPDASTDLLLETLRGGVADERAIARMAGGLAADRVVEASLGVVSDAADPMIRIELALRSGSGAVVAQASDMVPLGRLRRAVDGLVARLLRGDDPHVTLGAAGGSPGLPSTPAALRAYGEAVVTARRDPSAGRVLFERAAAQDGASVAVQAGLANILSITGDADGAGRAAREAMRLAAAWPPRARHLLASRLLGAVGSAEDAVGAAQEVASGTPDDRWAALDYANALGRAGRFGEASAYLAAATARSPRMGELFEVQIELSKLALGTGDFESGRRFAHKAAQLAQAAGQLSSEGLALVYEGWAAVQLDDIAGARTLADTALARGEAAEDLMVQGEALKVTALTLTGDPPAARRAIERRVAIHRLQADPAQISDALTTLAELVQWSDPQAAERALREAVAASEQAGDQMGGAFSDIILSSVLARRGEIAEATRRITSARAAFTARGEPDLVIAALAVAGEVSAAAGDLASARRLLAESVELAPVADGDRRAGTLAEAEMALRAGDAAGALALARGAASDKAAKPGAAAAIEAAALVRLGRLDEARAAVERAAGLPPASTSRAVLRAALALAEARAALEPDGDTGALTALAAEAARHRDVESELDARRLALQNAVRRGKGAAAARRGLAALAAEARRLGFQRLAR
jgi:eukaryotic-like serine/threonine-protein kinase